MSPAEIIITCQIQNRRSPTKTSTSNEVTRIFHRIFAFQDIRVLAKDFIRDLVHQRQDTPQSIEKAQRDLIIFILFVQQLSVKRYLHFSYASCSAHEPER